MGERVLMQGNEACALGAIKGGCRFYAGYPITPSSEIAETMARELPKIGGVFIQMEDEISSAAAIIGASLAGVKSMTATSGPGFSLMQEALGYAVMTETPCVFVNVMRGGPSTGLPTQPAQGDIMQARWGTHGDHEIIALYPWSVGETYKLIIKAFNYAEKYRTPVIFLMDEVLGHMRETFDMPDERDIRVIPRLTESELEEEEVYTPFSEQDTAEPTPTPLIEMGKARFHVSGLVHDESGFPQASFEVSDKLIRRLSNKIRIHADEIAMYEEFMTDDAEILVVAYGSVARSAIRAIKIARQDKIKVGLFRPITIWPVAANRLKRLLSRVEGVLFAEMNLGQYAKEILALSKRNLKVKFVTKVGGRLISPEEILDGISSLQVEIAEF
ncbi:MULTISPECIES: 2-oxoacid:acceptor oxidoreductase subunit alpha [Pseudothermotoga]|jgi:2-oxoglutarate ferredoxin oxidoreductase subunit alpha|uniref:Pyruvate flavodoxin/ferredoxin oxidoreductase domain protein n=1 Tax=Pseudothermotoga lettingae (strain ATCC BAA-301 / DSM 14385 / NBRC 107922 / TMO) TaxID=416591 RepID=A8F5Q4_PSELT|nr:MULTISPECIES: 2-oxoacid:acceptor oxidoreductase subunit alpha [Pseudothermotoga]ABV33488.1 pyruvate flavodoxin/ferredoxin oxidoreductase domain protein [Pseudothermotoga lettingae TMO]MDI3495759.1 2-oxoglutarate/2-oxoacid ferredoxin oxidoreductase subunit alpha [Pseudothermotoga sp.]MDK2883864.1 2-oxoglutarate/2-oxoacid ferredoxin oxidoreductase subunit alpha [Pseudothermotoga sp.]GLI49598.1 2-oxoglutarate ferredoxin oxidoreductase subunit alpha [Pseudothermotoga lettingae TMO]HBJ80437.1 2-